MPFVDVAASGAIRIRPNIPTIRYGRLTNFRSGVADARRSVETKEKEKVQSCVEEGVQPQHPPELAEPPPAGDPARGRDGQRQQKEDERQDTGRADGEVDRVGAEPAMPRRPTRGGQPAPCNSAGRRTW